MKKNVFYLLTTLLFASCSSSGVDDSTPNNNNNNGSSPNGNSPTSPEWLIPVAEVIDGGPGKDGIPSIDNPKFLTANNVTFLNDDDFVIGIVKGNEATAYPHRILDWHEIVNDEINGEFFTLNYCPLTGTAFGWEGVSNGTQTTFGVSGLLYNANLILYDRNTDSNWSQLRLECVNGSLIGNKPTLFNVVETNWYTWKTLYPRSKILSEDTGFSRNYNDSPYGDYSVNNDFFIFQPSFIDNALPSKERVYAIINGDKSKVYQFSKFTNGKAIKEEFNGKSYLVVGNENLIYSFELFGSYSDLTYEYAFNESEEVFFKDDEGNKWNVFGKAIEGPRTGQILIGAKSVVSYWFAIAVFYPNPAIYSE
jgi:Protein of unknown function (DUF3179)